MKQIVIELSCFERAAVINNSNVDAFYFNRGNEHMSPGDIFLGRVTDVHEGLQGAFVDIGFDRRGLINMSELLEFRNQQDNGEKRKDHFRINDMVSRGDRLIVQIKKGAVSHKGPLLTQFISLVDTSLIYLPYSSYIAVSHKIPSHHHEAYKKEMAPYLVNQEGAIIRTSAQDVTIDELVEQVNFTREKWERLKARAQVMNAPGLLSKESGIIKQVINDFSYTGINEVIVNSKEAYHLLSDYFQSHLKQHHLPKLTYREEPHLFTNIGIEKKFLEASKKRVPLKHGAYLLIEPTDALTVIDINTGTFKGQLSWEETALLTNQLAVREIAHQLRLRQIGGIIIIDLIKMATDEQYDLIIDELNKALEDDRSTTKVFGVTRLGLIEMTRKYAAMTIYDYISERNQH